MTSADIGSGLQLRSLVKNSGELELSLVRIPVAEPADDEIIIRVEATPINPSDLGLLLAAAAMDIQPENDKADSCSH
jgi:NADPH:quinone reductase-like Zn-dependent oxidoreductase